MVIRTRVNTDDTTKCPVRIQRRRILEQADMDDGFRREIMLACRESPALWINLFGWTKRQRSQDAEGHTVLSGEESTDMPYVLWQVQMDAIEQIAKHLPFKAGEKGKGGCIVIDKSREMGATWLVEAYLLHQWMFIKGRNFILMSRNEDLVDTRYVVDSLFGKIDYFLSWLPGWMRPEINRAENRLVNLANNNTFTGESTSKYAGQSQRAAACLTDEAAKIDNLEEISRNMGETVVVQILVSTPDKRGVAFTRLRNNPATTLIPMHWSRHPEKSIGRFIGKDGKWHSPWYDEQCRIWAHDPKYVAVNYDMDHSSAGDSFFPSDLIQNHRSVHACDPFQCGELIIQDGREEECLKTRNPRLIKWLPLESGRWKLWLHLNGGRPPQDDFYINGADIGMGIGAANSTQYVGSQELKRCVASFVSANILPEDHAREMVKAGIWFGGSHKPMLLAWEANGYGEVFGRTVMKYKWPLVYKRITKDKRAEKKTDKLGWWNSPTSIVTLLEQLRQCLVGMDARSIIVPDEMFLRECEDYMHFDEGGVGPAGLSDIPEKARANHGDRVIGCAIMVEAMIRAGRFRVSNNFVMVDKKGREVLVDLNQPKDEDAEAVAAWAKE